MKTYIRTTIKKYQYVEGCPLSGASAVGVAVLCVVMTACYVALIIMRRSVPVIFAAASFGVFVLTVAQWMLLPWIRLRRQRKQEFVLLMPLRPSVRPSRAYRISRWIVIIGLVVFCAGNCVFAIFEMKEPSASVFFVIGAIAAVCVGIYTERRDRP